MMVLFEGVASGNQKRWSCFENNSEIDRGDPQRGTISLYKYLIG